MRTATFLIEGIRAEPLEPSNIACGRDLASRAEKVLALHVEEEWEDLLGGPSAKTGRCAECGQDWPCPTVRLFNGEE